MKKGFTMVELIMVIVILGILAAVAIPRYVDLSNQAKIGATKGALGAIRSAIAISYAQNNGTLPATISGTMFTDGKVPNNPMNDKNTVSNDTVTGTGGWVYFTATGTVESDDAAHIQ